MQDKKFLQLNDIEAYKLAFHLSNYIWNIIIVWDSFSKSTIGYMIIFSELEKLPKAINSLIKYTDEKLKE